MPDYLLTKATEHYGYFGFPDGDEMPLDDKGAVFITHDKDGDTATVTVRAPRSTYEAKISLPILEWMAMTEGSWVMGQRQAWILEVVQIYGYINREHVMRKFGVSTPQASIILRQFQEHHPNAIVYNKTTKRYELADCDRRHTRG